jgi:hypothetical protein
LDELMLAADTECEATGLRRASFANWEVVANRLESALRGSDHDVLPRIWGMNQPLSGLRHPLPLRGGEGQGVGAVSIALLFVERTGSLSSVGYYRWLTTFYRHLGARK